MRDWVLAVLLLISGNNMEHNLGVAAVIVAVALMIKAAKETG
ncbi:hypothetical protein PEKONANI_10022 (plasmid) [Aeromonas jandaei]|jgi:hypothetical protein